MKTSLTLVSLALLAIPKASYGETVWNLLHEPGATIEFYEELSGQHQVTEGVAAHAYDGLPETRWTRAAYDMYVGGMNTAKSGLIVRFPGPRKITRLQTDMYASATGSDVRDATFDGHLWIRAQMEVGGAFLEIPGFHEEFHFVNVTSAGAAGKSVFFSGDYRDLSLWPVCALQFEAYGRAYDEGYPEGGEGAFGRTDALVRMNGLTVEGAPEPSSITLAALGGLGVLVWGYRKRSARSWRSRKLHRTNY